MAKTYLVQTWNAEGGLSNNYEVTLEKDSELASLKKFLRSKSPHVVVTPVAAKKPRK
jgi:hypothetical protein